jgi:hypothetical protein
LSRNSCWCDRVNQRIWLALEYSHCLTLYPKISSAIMILLIRLQTLLLVVRTFHCCYLYYSELVLQLLITLSHKLGKPSRRARKQCEGRSYFEGYNLMNSDLKIWKMKVIELKVKVTVVKEAQFRLGVATEQSQCILWSCDHILFKQLIRYPEKNCLIL